MPSAYSQPSPESGPVELMVSPLQSAKFGSQSTAHWPSMQLTSVCGALPHGWQVLLSQPFAGVAGWQGPPPQLF